MKSSLLRWTPVLLVGVVACAESEARMREMVTSELNTVTDAFQESIVNLDADAYLSIFAPESELRFTRDGQVVVGLHDEVRLQFGYVESMECDWPSRWVTVLSREAATVTFTYDCTGQNHDGQEWEGGGAWTNVFQSRGDRWIVVEVHESHSFPGEGEQSSP
ncbi:MAG: nuclear transport factor 2 family protein [Gemmatimonadetes bacterium]|nr:nuclear transport factor 2 family protein [Gemmatimonadota bacterium]